MNGVQRIAKERKHQLTKWSRSHDRTHAEKEIVDAAIDCLQSYRNGPGGFWPTSSDDKWGLGRKHNNNPRRLLEIAGALVAAELDRMKGLKL